MFMVIGSLVGCGATPNRQKSHFEIKIEYLEKLQDSCPDRFVCMPGVGHCVCQPVDIDNDGDGVVDNDDNCPKTPNSDQGDIDNDGVGDVCDNCVYEANSEQEDFEHDSIGDACDNCPCKGDLYHGGGECTSCGVEGYWKKQCTTVRKNKTKVVTVSYLPTSLAEGSFEWFWQATNQGQEVLVLGFAQVVGARQQAAICGQTWRSKLGKEGHNFGRQLVLSADIECKKQAGCMSPEMGVHGMTYFYPKNYEYNNVERQFYCVTCTCSP
jgi:hypothetical protein